VNVGGGAVTASEEDDAENKEGEEFFHLRFQKYLVEKMFAYVTTVITVPYSKRVGQPSVIALARLTAAEARIPK